MKVTSVGKVRDRRSVIIENNIKYVTVHTINGIRTIDLHVGGLTRDYIITLSTKDIDEIVRRIGNG
jgi:hypothetical protein